MKTFKQKTSFGPHKLASLTQPPRVLDCDIGQFFVMSGIPYMRVGFDSYVLGVWLLNLKTGMIFEVDKFEQRNFIKPLDAKITVHL